MHLLHWNVLSRICIRAMPTSGARAATKGASTRKSSAPIESRSDSLTPQTYRALKTEQGVFTTPPYSGDLKHLWKFKDAKSARESSSGLWERFEMYKEKGDFVGMDITRKFIQMGRTRSLRYALRKGGKKYEEAGKKGKGKGKRKRSDDSEDDEGEGEHEGHGRARAAGRKEIPRTGEVYDQGKLEGANVFEGYLDRCWADEVYKTAWEDWREAGKKSGTVSQRPSTSDGEDVAEPRRKTRRR